MPVPTTAGTVTYTVVVDRIAVTGGAGVEYVQSQVHLDTQTRREFELAGIDIDRTRQVLGKPVHLADRDPARGQR